MEVHGLVVYSTQWQRSQIALNEREQTDGEIE